MNRAIPPDSRRSEAASVKSTAVDAGSSATRLWLFDFDNTLAALEPEVDWAQSRRELESYLRSEGVDAAIFEQYPKGNLPLYDALLERLMFSPTAPLADGLRASPETLRRASKMIEAYELRGAERAVALPGAAELLRALFGHGIPVVIVTSNSSRTVVRWLELNRLNDCVGAIVGRDSMFRLKPAPDMIVHALRACAIAPSEAAFVGDSLADLGAARAAEITFYGVAMNPHARERLIAAGVGEVFASPAALAQHFILTSGSFSRDG